MKIGIEKRKHPAVPEVTILYILLCRHSIWLFFKFFDQKAIFYGCARCDVPISSMRARWYDPKGNKVPIT
jgi:hypothetical protein